MQNRYQHQQEVIAFLQNHFSMQHWKLTRPSSGRGHETYVAQGNNNLYFVKLGAHLPYYETMATLGLTPAIIATDHLADGVSILVQPYLSSRNPSWGDFQTHLEAMAVIVQKTHHNLALKATLPTVLSSTYRAVGATAVAHLQQKWVTYRPHVPAVADEIDATLTHLQQEISTFVGEGLVASHNDICNGNWIITDEGHIYLVDLDLMSQDDPAHDMGALLWWYYPPELRSRFLSIAGYEDDAAFRQRMRVRMALHCLDILLPRPQSFDPFDPVMFVEWLEDFRAVVAGEENPRGYDD